jgi:predicted nucleotidyltransferase
MSGLLPVWLHGPGRRQKGSTPGPRTTLFDLSGFALDIEEIVGRLVDVAIPRGLKARIRDRVLAEAVAL